VITDPRKIYKKDIEKAIKMSRGSTKRKSPEEKTPSPDLSLPQVHSPEAEEKTQKRTRIQFEFDGELSKILAEAWYLADLSEEDRQVFEENLREEGVPLDDEETQRALAQINDSVFEPRSGKVRIFRWPTDEESDDGKTEEDFTIAVEASNGEFVTHADLKAYYKRLIDYESCKIFFEGFDYYGVDKDGVPGLCVIVGS
jgi:hypothetical protein